MKCWLQWVEKLIILIIFQHKTPPTGHIHYSKFKKRNEKIWVLVLHIKTVNYRKHFHFSKAQYFFMLKADLNFDSSE